MSAVEQLSHLPAPRGPRSLALLRAFTRRHGPRGLPMSELPVGDPLADDDLHLTLYLCYELHYRGLPGVDEDAEWDPDVLRFRRGMEEAFEGPLRAALEPAPAVTAERIPGWLRATARDDGGRFSRYLERHADLARFREFVIHRSAYHLKEADPHSFAIPRLWGAAKSALAEIQADEYGGGDPARMHSHLFAQTMSSLGLDPTYGAYLDRIPGSALATVNLMSMFGLHRRLRGAAVGHLAMFELTSTQPNRRYGNGLRRSGADQLTTRFFDEHVEADAVHETIAAQDLAGGLVRIEPSLTSDVVFGARALLHLENRHATRVLDAWERGRSSLLAQRGRGGTGRVA
jgi:hypothetical protein